MIIDKENNNVFIISKLNQLSNVLNQDPINLERVRHMMQQISEFNNAVEYQYMKDLLDPLNKKGVKIPTDTPTPTCSFQLHNYATFRANENGFDVFTCNPWFLAKEGFEGKKVQIGENTTFYLAGTVSPYFFCRLNTVDGTKPTDYWSSATSFSFAIPNVYSKYRLVSACAILKYVGELEQAQGVMGAAVTFTKSNDIAFGYGNAQGTYNYGSLTQNFNDYGDFELMRDSFFSQEASCLEGIKILYFPLDNSYNEFKTVYDGSKTKWKMIPDVGPVATISDDFFKTGFNWMFYLHGCPYDGTKRMFRIDFYMNYECIPNAEFLNYMPISVNNIHITPEARKKMIDKVKEEAIQKLYK